MGRRPKLRTCDCCGEAKMTTAFSWNYGRRMYRPTCRSCGNWERLLIKQFGKKYPSGTPPKPWDSKAWRTKQQKSGALLDKVWR
jgi:hypothetical protein